MTPVKTDRAVLRRERADALQEMLRISGLMSNLLYNLKQKDFTNPLDADFAIRAGELQTEFDSARNRYRIATKKETT